MAGVQDVPMTIPSWAMLTVADLIIGVVPHPKRSLAAGTHVQTGSMCPGSLPGGVICQGLGMSC